MIEKLKCFIFPEPFEQLHKLIWLRLKATTATCTMKLTTKWKIFDENIIQFHHKWKLFIVKCILSALLIDNKFFNYSKPEKTEPLTIPTTKFPQRNRVLTHLEEAQNIINISKCQIDSLSKTKALPTVQKIHHCNFSCNLFFFFFRTKRSNEGSENNWWR